MGQEGSGAASFGWELAGQLFYGLAVPTLGPLTPG